MHYLKIFLSVTALVFLVYKLITFELYAEFCKLLTKIDCKEYYKLALALALTLANLCCETIKWKFLSHNIQSLSLHETFRSVLTGISGAIITPNRLGEFPARALHFEAGKRLGAITMGGVGSILQTLVICTCGIPALSVFFQTHSTPLVAEHTQHYYYTLACTLICTCLLLPRLSHWLVRKTRNNSLTQILEAISQIRFNDLLLFLSLSFIRYGIFCTQMWLMLQFFGISIPTPHILIPVYYLFITFTPHLSFTEAVVRGSWGIFVFGTQCENTLGIVAATVLLWGFNNVLPVLINMFQNKIVGNDE